MSDIIYLRNFIGIAGVGLVAIGSANYDWRLGVIVLGISFIIIAVVGMIQDAQ